MTSSSAFVTFIDRSGAVIWKETADEARIGRLIPGLMIEHGDERWVIQKATYSQGSYRVIVYQTPGVPSSA